MLKYLLTRSPESSLILRDNDNAIREILLSENDPQLFEGLLYTYCFG